jgi:hypothetical protein
VPDCWGDVDFPLDATLHRCGFGSACIGATVAVGPDRAAAAAAAGGASECGWELGRP